MKLKLGRTVFSLNKYKTKDGVNFCLKYETGNILMNIESSKMLGNRVVVMTDSFNAKGFSVDLVNK